MALRLTSSLTLGLVVSLRRPHVLLFQQLTALVNATGHRIRSPLTSLAVTTAVSLTCQQPIALVNATGLRIRSHLTSLAVTTAVFLTGQRLTALVNAVVHRAPISQLRFHSGHTDFWCITKHFPLCRASAVYKSMMQIASASCTGYVQANSCNLQRA